MTDTGAVTFTLQFFVFVGLLFFLLGLETDPLTMAVRVLPLSETTRARTKTAFSNALRGVFVSSLMLALFHSLFMWLALRAAGVHFVYICTVATAVFTLLPVVPGWLFCVPGVLELVIKVGGHDKPTLPLSMAATRKESVLCSFS